MYADDPMQGRLILKDARGELHTIPVKILVQEGDVSCEDKLGIHDQIRAIAESGHGAQRADQE